MSTWQFACNLIQQSSPSAVNSKWRAIPKPAADSCTAKHILKHLMGCCSVALHLWVAWHPARLWVHGMATPQSYKFILLLIFCHWEEKRLGSKSHWQCWVFLLLSQLLQLQIGVQLSEDTQGKVPSCGAFKCNHQRLLGCKHPASCTSTFIPLNN